MGKKKQTAAESFGTLVFDMAVLVTGGVGGIMVILWWLSNVPNIARALQAAH